MYRLMVNNMGTEEQIKKWMPDINKMKIHGCYCQTELGHGTNVQALETTATFDETTDEIILHSPSITSYKFWPGELGYHTNVPIVVARLIVKGEDKGVQSFLVRIRDENHNPLPGVDVGDIGPKFGFNMKDNGYLGFTHFRIPRENMLMKYTSLSRDGTFKTIGNPKILYSVLLNTRILLLNEAYWTMVASLTIGIRYAIVRT